MSNIITQAIEDLYNNINGDSLETMSSESKSALLHLLPKLKNLETALKSQVKVGSIKLEGVKIGESSTIKSLTPDAIGPIAKKFVKREDPLISSEHWRNNCLSVSYNGVVKGLMDDGGISQEAAEQMIQDNFADYIVTKTREPNVTIVKNYFEDRQLKERMEADAKLTDETLVDQKDLDEMHGDSPEPDHPF